MIYLFRKTVYNCRQATLLSIKKEEGKITLVESLKLRYHLLFCDPCRRFIEQWSTINMRNAGSTRSVPFKLPDEARSRIESLLRENDR
jgi:hypothetical protein